MNQVYLEIRGSKITIPEGTQLLLIGPPGSAKIRFALSIMRSQLASGTKGVFATMTLTPSQVRALATKINTLPVGNLEIIDGVSSIAGKASTEKRSFRSLSELNSMSLVLLDSIQNERGGICCVDSLSTLLIYSDPSSVLKFVQVVSAKMKSQGITGIFVLEEGVHEPELASLLSFILDGVLHVRENDSQGELRYEARVEYVRGKIVDSRWVQLD